ncbi:hypothetical protein CRG98_046507 [Punica granatum]|uniref:Protein RETICULATA-RELATED 4, chloroplastic-like n=1 Tax=Punica granatum TaxID=22663 RepID=A0A2I0HNF6_PUNGR|nr:hypothetical protein CRG98_046507 [Punica granatum]
MWIHPGAPVDVAESIGLALPSSTRPTESEGERVFSTRHRTLPRVAKLPTPKMALATCFLAPSFSLHVPSVTLLCLPGASASAPPPLSSHLRLSLSPTATSVFSSAAPLILCSTRNLQSLVVPYATAGGGGNGNRGSSGGGGGGDHDGGADNNRKEALMVLAEADRPLESLPKDLAAAIQAGRIPGSVVSRFFELEKSPMLRWLMQFGGFKERLLADDLFLAKVAMECGVGIFTKTAAEYERRRENFFKELEIVFADVVMAVIADFMLVYLPAPTVSLRPALAKNAGSIAKFFHNCPDNAFQIALRGTSYSLAQRLGAIARNGAKLFAVGTTSSLVGTAVTNALINARKVVDKSSAGEVENVPILSTSAAYGTKW